MENFLRCHLSIIRLLDAAKQLNILDEVGDEGDYWQERDVVALAHRVGGVELMDPGWEGRLVDRLGRSLNRTLEPAVLG